MKPRHLSSNHYGILSQPDASVYFTIFSLLFSTFAGGIHKKKKKKKEALYPGKKIEWRSSIKSINKKGDCFSFALRYLALELLLRTACAVSSSASLLEPVFRILLVGALRLGRKQPPKDFRSVEPRQFFAPKVLQL
jgi:hypothetical protein